MGILIFLPGCTTPHPANQRPQVTSTLPAATAAPTSTFTLTAQPSWTPGPTPIPTTPTPPFEICSPLEAVTLADLPKPDLLKNPFAPPRPGLDDGHFGDDFAYWSRGDRKTMLGLPVLSVLNGRVAAIIQNRQPYGNAVIIETSLTAIPPSWLPVFPTLAPPVQPAASLYCPPDLANYAGHPGRSLYLLYAHFNKPPIVALNQAVACGQAIGEVGTTGRSVNPHLHFETRVGPAGITFPEMTHYDNAATNLEMATYCSWRVRGIFQAFDPLKLLSLQP